MKSKIITLVIVWLFIATATAAAVAYIRYQKENELSLESAKKIDATIAEEKQGQDQAQINGRIDSSLRSKEDILADLDRGMEKLLEE